MALALSCAPHDRRIELTTLRNEVNRGVHRYPIVLAIGTGDVAISARGDLVHDAPFHRRTLPDGDWVAGAG